MLKITNIFFIQTDLLAQFDKKRTQGFLDYCKMCQLMKMVKIPDEVLDYLIIPSSQHFQIFYSYTQQFT